MHVLKQGCLEIIIANALWSLEENGNHEIIDVSNVQQLINSGEQKWAYTTVKTVLDRLVEKKIAKRIKLGKKYSYKSEKSRITSGEDAIKRIAKEYFNNNIEELLNAAQKLTNDMFSSISN